MQFVHYDMSDEGIVDFVGEWQNGALLLIGSLLGGLIIGFIFGGSGSTYLIALFGGIVITFLVLSYVLYS